MMKHLTLNEMRYYKLLEPKMMEKAAQLFNDANEDKLFRGMTSWTRTRKQFKNEYRLSVPYIPTISTSEIPIIDIINRRFVYLNPVVTDVMSIKDWRVACDVVKKIDDKKTLKEIMKLEPRPGIHNCAKKRLQELNG